MGGFRNVREEITSTVFKSDTDRGQVLEGIYGTGEKSCDSLSVGGFK